MHMQFITEVNTIAVDNFSIGSSYNIRFTDETLKTLTCIGKGTDFVMFQDRYPDLLFSLTMTTAASVASIDESSGGTTNYNDLSNKPQINSHTLFGNMSASDLGLVTPSDLSDYVTQDDLDDYVTDTELTTALADKQDVINDLTDIRSGAAAGATAVQPAALNDYATTAAVTTALAGKQDTLTTAQQTAVDSGITSALVTQIGTNQNNILSCKAFTDNATIDSNRKLYISATEPTGDIPQGSTWIDGKTIKTYGRSDNLWDESYPNISSEFRYIGINVGAGKFTLSTTTPQTEYATLCFIAGNVDSGASTGTNGVWTGQSRTVTAVDGYVTIAYRIYGQSPVNYNTMLNAGDTAETYQSYYDWV